MNTGLSPTAPIFCDLDGVLLDVSERFYRLHCALQPDNTLTKSTYWELKRERQPVGEDAGYRAAWLAAIETTEYLAHDTIMAGAGATLGRLRKSHPVILVTLRQQRQQLEEQLHALGLWTEFQAVLSSPGSEPAVKERLIRESAWCQTDAVVVGDTEVDVRAGKALGLATVAVCSGLRSRQCLTRENPNFLIKSINGLAELFPVG